MKKPPISIGWVLKRATWLPRAILPRCITYGRGVRQDVREAFRLETLAAEQNFGLAQRRLGIMYMVGTGIPQDYVQAPKWLNLSAAQGDEDARIFRDELAKKMTLDQIAEAQKLAREWRPKGK